MIFEMLRTWIRRRQFKKASHGSIVQASHPEIFTYRSTGGGMGLMFPITEVIAREGRQVPGEGGGPRAISIEFDAVEWALSSVPGTPDVIGVNWFPAPVEDLRAT